MTPCAGGLTAVVSPPPLTALAAGASRAPCWPGSATELAASAERPEPQPVVSESARNRFVGLVTRVVRDTVMAQVEIQAGPHRFVSLISREAADELQLEPGVLAVASVKSTSVVIEVPTHP